MFNKFFAILLLLTGIATEAHAQTYRDVLFMKNGSIIKGFYKEIYPDDSIRMETIDGGIFICAMNDVARIAKEKASLYVVDIQEPDQLPPRKWRPKGYRAFIELSESKKEDNTNIIHNSTFTIHGYQFNRHLFLGGGIGIERIYYQGDQVTLYSNTNNMPVFTNATIYITHGQIAPLVDCRIGYSFIGYKDLYFSPGIGVDFGISPRIGGYVLIGYTIQKNRHSDDGTGDIKSFTIHGGFHF
ncbi:MAG: hypothetical protein K6E54_05815 [Bacteroidaceae bacterium]|nr:hypothetical protein [Bacteroidaceae bacterium]